MVGASSSISANSELFYDEVTNPTDVLDPPQPVEWPAGAQPVHRNMSYDSLYRLTSIQYRVDVYNAVCQVSDSTEQPTLSAAFLKEGLQPSEFI